MIYYAAVRFKNGKKQIYKVSQIVDWEEVAGAILADVPNIKTVLTSVKPAGEDPKVMPPADDPTERKAA